MRGRFFGSVALGTLMSFVVLALCLIMSGCGGGSGSSGGSGSNSGGGGGSGGGGSTPTLDVGKTKYIRTDAATEYFGWVNGSWSIYEPSTSRIFVTDPGLGRVIVVDAKTESEIGSISVPGALSVDDTPNHKTIYVGTAVGDLYALDPIAMTVKQRYPKPEIGPYGFFTSSAQVLSNGNVALLGAL
jgi:hypothetical protein